MRKAFIVVLAVVLAVSGSLALVSAAPAGPAHVYRGIAPEELLPTQLFYSDGQDRFAVTAFTQDGWQMLKFVFYDTDVSIGAVDGDVIIKSGSGGLEQCIPVLAEQFFQQLFVLDSSASVDGRQLSVAMPEDTEMRWGVRTMKGRASETGQPVWATWISIGFRPLALATDAVATTESAGN